MNTQLNFIGSCPLAPQDAQLGKQMAQDPGVTGVFAMLLEAMTGATESTNIPGSILKNAKDSIVQPAEQEKQLKQDQDMLKDNEVLNIPGITIIKYDSPPQYLAVEGQKTAESGPGSSTVNYQAANNQLSAALVSGDTAAPQIVLSAEPAEPVEPEPLIKLNAKETFSDKDIIDTPQVLTERNNGEPQAAQKTSGDYHDLLQAPNKGDHKTAEIPENQDAWSDLPESSNKSEMNKLDTNKIVFFEQQIKEAEGGDSPQKSSEPVYLKAPQLAEDLPRLIRAELSRYNAKNGDGEFLIHLEPRELGKLIVKLTSQEGVISVKILVDQTDTRTLIDNSLPNLKHSFAEQGIRFGRMDVEVSAQFADTGGQQKNNWFNEQQKMSRENWPREHYTESALDLTQALSPIAGRVDYLV